VRLPGAVSLLEIEKNLESLQVVTRTLLNPNLKPDDRASQYAGVDAARAQYKKAWEVYEPLPRSPEETALWDQFKQALAGWEKETNDFLKLSKELEATEVPNPSELVREIERIRADHFRYLSDAQFLASGGSADAVRDHQACQFTTWIEKQAFSNSKIKQALFHAKSLHATFHTGIDQVKNYMVKGWDTQAVEVLTNEAQPAANGMFSEFQALRDEAQRAQTLFEKMNAQAMGPCVEKQRSAVNLLSRILKGNEDIAAASVKAGESDSDFARLLAIVGMLSGFGIAVALGAWLSISISRALRRISAGLSEGAEQVSAAAGEVSAASQSLAEGSSRQAAGIEETSSSLEEMSSMTSRNADNSKQADGLMKEAISIVDKANHSMESLTTSMTDIAKASEETSKIIRTIDEIAFQTNLLALNAAVEAARAGQAGAGFAVVADEVRNLARRAADAAKNTASLIEGTVNKVKAGSQTVGATAAAFSELADHTVKVSGLVSEIAAASSEQSQGIDQVNSSVSEIDKVTQQNAANAEESAAAAEQMSAQAERMKSMVNELAALVDGSSRKSAVAAAAAPPADGEADQSVESAADSALIEPRAAQPSPQQILPLEEKDF
jgi:methyl-accepting chemotaxis protein